MILYYTAQKRIHITGKKKNKTKNKKQEIQTCVIT